MQVQVNTDNHIQADARLIEHVESVVLGSMERFGERVTRVEVHLTDENSRERAGGGDKRCVLEARLAGMQPLSVSDSGDSVALALKGAADKLEKLVGRTLEKQAGVKGNTSMAGDQEVS